LVVACLFVTNVAFAAANDLVLAPGNVSFSTNVVLEGKSVRIYATVTNASQKDLRGVVRFFDEKEEIAGDQPVSVLGSKDDAVFVDWKPKELGDHKIKIVLVPFENPDDNLANNTVERTITVLADTDRDGISNAADPDDDNDGCLDDKDSFPLDRAECLDSDGDRIGNNKDTDDDNDGVLDEQDAFPLDPTESVDTDKDGIGDNADLDDDNDGVSDVDEIKNGTNPKLADTDGDGINDKEDGWPLDALKGRDFDKDGIPDGQDTDADNDGVLKAQDINDTNLGPVINVTSNSGKSLPIFVPPNTSIEFETTTSVDPDGKVVKSEWQIGEQKIEGPVLKTKFTSMGFRKIAVKVTDDKNESKEKVFTVLVTPVFLPWLLITALFLIIILAIFLVFSYSKRRQSRWERVDGYLDMIQTVLSKFHKKK